MTRDDDILRRIELWATGATIHNVKGLIGLYRTFAAVLDDPKKYKGSELGRNLDRCRQDLAVVAKTMEDWMAHGDYRKARRDNPLSNEQEEGTRADFPWTRVEIREGRFNYLSKPAVDRVRVVTAKDGRKFKLALNRVEVIAAPGYMLTATTCHLIEIHYARWGKLPGWTFKMFAGYGGAEMYDDWYKPEEKLP